MSPLPFEPLGLDHIVLRVRDKEVSRAFYVDKIGCAVDHINDVLKIVHLRFGAQMIDLVEGNGADEYESLHGIDHFCLSVKCDDLEKVAEAAVAMGMSLDGELLARRGAYGVGPSFYVQDPDGYRVEFKPRDPKP